MIYRKHGRVIRREGDVLIRVDEAGEAYERDGCFFAAPIDPALDLPPLDPTDVEQTANAIAGPIERLIVSEGIAAHSYGDEEWTDRTRRVHLALVNRAKGLRALLDFGDFDLDIVPRVADALARVEGERDAPERMRLAPNVAAALLPSLTGAVGGPPAARTGAPRRARSFTLVQMALGLDGNGVPIEARVAAPPHPNVWRPSYRIRPVPMPFHLRAAVAGDIDRDLPEAIALLGPSRFLVVDGSRAFATTFTVRRVLAVGEPQRWFPYGAGAFGAEMIVAG